MTTNQSEKTTGKLSRAMGLWDVVLLNVVAIVGLRWLLTAAQIGAQSVILWLLALAVFFIPQGFAVSELSAQYPEEGGIYSWTKRAFGPFHGFISGWCYWVNNLIYYPSLLIFLAGNAVFIAGSGGAETGGSSIYVAAFSIGVLWIAMILNMIGLRTGKWVQNLGALGNWLPATVLIILGIAAAFIFGSQTSFSISNLLPNLGSVDTISFWALMCFGFAGLELASVMGEEIEDTRRTIPRAIVISGVIITGIYILGTVAMLIIFPSSEVNVISGIVESIGEIGNRMGMPWLLNAMALSITIGGIGGAGAWLAGTARIPFVVGIDNFLPPVLSKVHPKWETPYIAILVQGILSTLFILMSVIGSTIEEAYLVLLDATLILYFIPYLYLFVSLVKLRMERETQDVPAEESVMIPGKRFGLWGVALAGFFATGVSIVFSLIPSGDIANPLLYEIKVVGGSALFIIVGLLFYLYGKRQSPVNQRPL